MTGDNWQEAWDKMEETERRERDIGEPPEPCGECGGAGSFWRKEAGGSLSGCRTLCRRCLGTGQK